MTTVQHIKVERPAPTLPLWVVTPVRGGLGQSEVLEMAAAHPELRLGLYELQEKAEW